MSTVPTPQEGSVRDQEGPALPQIFLNKGPAGCCQGLSQKFDNRHWRALSGPSRARGPPDPVPDFRIKKNRELCRKKPIPTKGFFAKDL